jgi:hypothetical protein
MVVLLEHQAEFIQTQVITVSSVVKTLVTSRTQIDRRKKSTLSNSHIDTFFSSLFFRGAIDLISLISPAETFENVK